MNLFTSFANRIVFGHIELRWHSSAQIKKNQVKSWFASSFLLQSS